MRRPLAMYRMKGLNGPLFQKFGSSMFIKTTGAFQSAQAIASEEVEPLPLSSLPFKEGSKKVKTNVE